MEQLEDIVDTYTGFHIGSLAHDVAGGYTVAHGEEEQVGIVALVWVVLVRQRAPQTTDAEHLSILIALYFVIKWAVKNGIKEAYSAITGKKTDEDIQNEKELKELGLDSEDQ